MRRLLRNIYFTFFKRKFFSRILLTNILIILVSLGILIVTVSENITKDTKEKEIKFNTQILNGIKTYFEAKQSVVKKIIQQMFFDRTTYSYIFDLVEQTETREAEFREKKAKLDAFLVSAFAGDPDITSISLYPNKTGLFQPYFINKWGGAREVPAEEELWLERITDDLSGVVVTPSYGQRLPGAAEKRVFAVGSNVRSRDLNMNAGKLLVHFDAASLRSSYAQYEDEIKGTILILDKEGELIFDSSSRYEKPIPELNDIVNKNMKEYQNDNYIVNMLQTNNGFTVAGVMPKKEIYSSIEAIKAEIYKIGLLCVILSVLLNTASMQIFSRRVKALLHAIRRLPKLDLLRPVVVKSSGDEIGQIAEQFNVMQERLIEYINKVYVAEIDSKNATLVALQSQINPHFLANTLESIRMKAITDGNSQVADMIYSLSTMFRYVILKDGIVTLKDELSYCEMYLKIFSYRFAHQLIVRIDAEDDISHYAIGKLLLQPLIENSMVHGVDPEKETHCIHIRCRKTDVGIRIGIEDNGRGIPPDKLQSIQKQWSKSAAPGGDKRIGLHNTNERIRMLFGLQYGLRLDSEEGQGTKVTLDIPALTKEEMNHHV
ncbi:sensor histidine kinase [Paenibacillus contaminans]|uniref:HAMP domain-containing protein n=1 Tax=Paenibacillus contaminans TaxID=450362 RepID=A0A329LM38_9BACL|nr:histidine kinase [Paenibacillus contaminans]RAV08310.1 hypothetical protein DQG23_41285 [Paenibacillus contaminans]